MMMDKTQPLVHKQRSIEELAHGDVEIPQDDFEDEWGKIPFSWHKLWLFTGPGWLMSMAYLDPGNLTSDLQQGAYTNYQLIWVLWWSTVVGWVLQTLSSRLGVTTGMNLAEHCREGYPTWASVIIFLQMELAIIGADIQEVLGSAIALEMLFGWKLWVGCVVTAFSTFGFLAVQKFGVRILEGFFAVFIGIMAICFVYNWGKSGSDAKLFMEGWAVPEMSSYAIVQAVGIIGAVIMPHNLYLHSGLVLSRKIDVNNNYRVREGNYYNSMESGCALFVSFWINVAIVATFANKFYDSTCAESSGDGAPFGCVDTEAMYRSTGTARTDENGHTNYQCAAIGLQLAGEALKSSLGSGATYVWAVGLLCAGQAATTTATYAGQILMAGFFKIDLPMWVVMMITRFCALGPAVVIALIASGNPSMQAQMNEWLNVLQSVQLPFALIPVLHFTSKRAVMGRHANSIGMKALCWVLAILILAVNVFLIYTTLPFPSTLPSMLLVSVFVVADYAFIFYLCSDQIMELFAWIGAVDRSQFDTFPPIDMKHRRADEDDDMFEDDDDEGNYVAVNVARTAM